MHDDHDRPHHLVRDLEGLEDIEDLAGGTIDARNLADDDAGSIAPAYGVPGVPETWPSRSDAPDEAAETVESEKASTQPTSSGTGRGAVGYRPLTDRLRARGVQCMVVQLTDGRRIVYR